MFNLVRSSHLPSQNSQLDVYEHSVYKTKLYFITPPESIADSTFAISFNTPPTDSTGIQHICEHSVLCGSQRYPVKEPFGDLLQSSLQTFLNAFTYTEHTCYPVSSRCEADFYNLVSVYLDAVFNPSFQTDDRIFKQEGFHLHLENAQDPLKYSGVVLNEMRGVYSDPQQKGQSRLQSNLFNNSSLGFESGGDPEQIITLTAKKLNEFQNEFYQPENGTVFVMSRFQPEKILNLINSLLPEHTRGGRKHFNDFKNIKPIPTGEAEFASEEGKFHVFRGIIGKKIENVSPLEHYLIKIADYTLHDAPGAPVSQRVEESGICESFSSQYDNSQEFSVITQSFQGCGEKYGELNEIVKKCYAEILGETEGELNTFLTEKKIKSVINHLLIEMNEVTGEYGISLMGDVFLHALYGIDNFDAFLDHNAILKQIEEMDWNDLKAHIVQIIQQYFQHEQSIFTLKPNAQLNVQQNQADQQSLEALKASMTPEQIEALIQETHHIMSRQLTHDTPEQKACLPKLSLSDLNAVTNGYSSLKLKEQKHFIHFDTETQLIYFKLIFFPEVKSIYDMQVFSLLTDILTNVRTEKYTLDELSTEISSVTGGIELCVDSMKDDFELAVEFKCLPDKLHQALELIVEILTKSDFSDSQRIQQQITKAKQDISSELDGDGVYEAIQQVSIGSIVKQGVVDDKCGWFGYLKFLKSIEFENQDEGQEDEDEEEQETESTILQTIPFEEIQQQLQGYLQLLAKQQMLCIVGSDKVLITQIEQSIAQNFSCFKVVNEISKQNLDFIELFVPHEIKINADVNYVVKAVPLTQITPHLILANQIVTTKYLWDQVRVTGGAYGCNATVMLANLLMISSYRDPNHQRTIEKYDGIAEYLQQLELTETDLDQLKIGTVGARQPPSTPYERFDKAIQYYIMHVDSNNYKGMVDEIKYVNLQGVKKCADIYQQLSGVQAAVAKGK
ncbi:Insulinase [Hexamita inflata]|uniref:Insulinase n=1 Tax=Hexamita inflata TaxID=28002 RepID=A0AA86P1T5_9EUKA|nr:Insulinase [Hexamita inflata]